MRVSGAHQVPLPDSVLSADPSPHGGSHKPLETKPLLAFTAMQSSPRPATYSSRPRRRTSSLASKARVTAKAIFTAPLAAALLAAALSLTGPGTAARASSADAGFGAIPPDGNIQSRCQGVHVGSHVVFPGQKVVATTSAGICGGAPKDISWEWDIPAGDGGRGCTKDATTCSFKAGGPTTGYGVVCIIGGNVQGGWESCDYVGVAGKGVGVIDGYVKDKDGGPVAGTDVKAYGTESASTTSGADGYYAMEVKAGNYRIVPSGGPRGKSAPDYVPKFNATTIADGTEGRADFTLQAGIELKLRFAKSTVAADGLQVVDGTITTTEGGKPLPNIGVQLEVMPGETADEAVTTGPRAAVCNNGSRVWPTGMLQSPDGFPVSVTTDATGHYDLAITVGTTPGVWRLEATAKNADGSLSTDVTAASDTQSITFDKVAGPTTTPADFVTEFDNAAKPKTTGLYQISGNSNTIVNTLAQTTATQSIATKLGGLAYALVNAPDGQSVLVFLASKPPVIDAKGALPPSADNADDLVMDPAEWTGAGLPASFTNRASFQAVLDGGMLQFVPTLAEFDSAKPVTGWKTVRQNQVTIFSTSFEYLGWGYPGIAAAGACY
jgi:hypothetical protein